MVSATIWRGLAVHNAPGLSAGLLRVSSCLTIFCGLSLAYHITSEGVTHQPRQDGIASRTRSRAIHRYLAQNKAGQFTMEDPGTGCVHQDAPQLFDDDVPSIGRGRST
ncbi:hypothetical protein P389DRAFT_102648 [Cystobasidium minutum MCA 4210]|uniref:uncharacterized protein n=1 Tax=Cystobasidium minutum MCA 4210 TaxID=1397322 RepID=UPI0034CEABE3|eukprot:jgi/Rhomi1/102648/CE102647_87